MKNFVTKVLLTFFICTSILLSITRTETQAMPSIAAKGVVLMDGKSGEILFSQNPDVQYEPASITKVITAIVVLENTKLDDKVTIGQNPTLVDGSAIGIKEGEVYTVEELLIAMLLESANDCAEALAEHVAGSNAEFAKLMTQKASDIGAKNSVFKNPSGLHEEGHLTTAYDMAVIMRYALTKDDFVRISRMESYKYDTHPYSDGTEKWATNRNNCYVQWSPYYYSNLYSGKTGWTPEANHTYVAAALKDDQLIIGSFINAEDKAAQYTGVGELFDWAFDNFHTVQIVQQGEELGQYKINDNISIPLLASRNIYHTFNAGEDTNVERTVNYDYKDLSKVSIKKGDVLFNATISLNGTELGNIDLESGTDREYTVGVQMEQTLTSIKESTILLVLTLIAFSILIYILLRKRKLIKRKNEVRRKFNF